MSTKPHQRNWKVECRRPVFFKFPEKELVWLCIGTDRSSGDSLGPFVGTMLTEAGVANVYGTIDEPVHALNLEETIKIIDDTHRDACIISIDAALGKSCDVGRMVLGEGAIFPRIGVGKGLPSVGNLHIIGTVNASGLMEYVVINNTRLSLVIKMAKSITDFILRSLEAMAVEDLNCAVAATTDKEVLK